MRPIYRGLLVALLQCAIVLSMTAKYQWDRDRLPRVWARVSPVDPNAPLRGRYLMLRLQVAMDNEPGDVQHVRLSVQNGQLTATPDEKAALTVGGGKNQAGARVLSEPVSFFLPDTAKDSRLNFGEELWVEVSVPYNALPRPIRLGIKKDGVLTPLDLR